ncbi:DNA repair protein RecO [Candidatus Nomurabacteria bacterium]|nr:DNA repair protein RecO [Candidatus Saccharibacteria bacterium]MCA9313585.1 DNA repair protein RecO [Candidatus Saccharibacteria bacterium]MCB9822337.1 DNA repair protein RecO [Candidatus Nomurabacteria bacterium]MCB9822622.1 DNA repair protein RecO [Candidatus Nomurabacteria bacterium]
MRQYTTKAIVLRRINYGEADRIVTFLTPKGKVKAMVKGVRRSKSKLAGGIELFSESAITFLETRGDLMRIVSTRLDKHWDAIVGDLQRMMFGYEAMKLVDKIIEDESEGDYYLLLRSTLESLASTGMPIMITELWFYLNLLKIQGHSPNLEHDSEGNKLEEDKLYAFALDDMCFSVNTMGNYRAEHIKLFRLCIAQPPRVVGQVKGLSSLSESVSSFIGMLRIILD